MSWCFWEKLVFRLLQACLKEAQKCFINVSRTFHLGVWNRYWPPWDDGCLQSNVAFHQNLSSNIFRLQSKVIFHELSITWWVGGLTLYHRKSQEVWMGAQMIPPPQYMGIRVKKWRSNLSQLPIILESKPNLIIRYWWDIANNWYIYAWNILIY